MSRSFNRSVTPPVRYSLEGARGWCWCWWWWVGGVFGGVGAWGMTFAAVVVVGGRGTDPPKGMNLRAVTPTSAPVHRGGIHRVNKTPRVLYPGEGESTCITHKWHE